MIGGHQRWEDSPPIVQTWWCVCGLQHCFPSPSLSTCIFKRNAINFHKHFKPRIRSHVVNIADAEKDLLNSHKSESDPQNSNLDAIHAPEFIPVHFCRIKANAGALSCQQACDHGI